MVMFQILLDGAEPCDAGMIQLSSPVCRRGGQPFNGHIKTAEQQTIIQQCGDWYTGR